MTVDVHKLKAILNYDPSTGVFTRKVTVRGRWLAGTTVGSLRSDGALMIRLPGKGCYLAHRLAWFYHYGVWPTYEVDHKNGVRSDNRIDNLRDIPHRGNMENIGAASKNNKLGILGVDYVKRINKFRGRICVAGRNIMLGWFDTASAAHAAYLRAKEQHHLFSNRLRPTQSNHSMEI